MSAPYYAVGPSRADKLIQEAKLEGGTFPGENYALRGIVRELCIEIDNMVAPPFIYDSHRSLMLPLGEATVQVLYFGYNEDHVILGAHVNGAWVAAKYFSPDVVGAWLVHGIEASERQRMIEKDE